MTPAARLAAAIEVLDTVLRHHRPPGEALSDWGKTHRFAGSGDRAAIGNLVHDALRRRLSHAHRMGEETARALVLAVFVHDWQVAVADLPALFADDRHAPPPPTPAEVGRLAAPEDETAPAHVRADLPAWLFATLETAFGEAAIDEARAMAARAPVDLRVNTLKATPDKAAAALKHLDPAPTPISPVGLRIAAKPGPARTRSAEGEPAHAKGLVEVQDEGSQLAALLSGAAPGEQVVDLCAGAGGKTLALAAMMQNTGQIHAYDADRRRLAKIFERIRRAGTRNVQVIEPNPPGAAAGDAPHPLAPLSGRADLVLVDAPCSGSGTWRRRPESKWRLSERALATRHAEQVAVLDDAAPLVKPGGRLAYVTCSLLPDENADQISAFRLRHPDFEPIDMRAQWRAALGAEPPAGIAPGHAMLTPHRHGTDGFFIALLRRLA